jgi:hypothetical protein
MGNRKVIKHQIAASEKGREKLAQQQVRDDAYHAALGIPTGTKLPQSLGNGNTASAGGGRDRRSKASGGIGDSPDKRKAGGGGRRAWLTG